MTLIDKWRAHVEAHKFTGPTVKVLELEPGLWAILDHEYNLVSVVEKEELAAAITLCPHPPQRERPKPVIYNYPDLASSLRDGESVTIRFPNINSEDLDL